MESTLALYRIRVIANVFTVSGPSFVISDSVDLRIHDRSHTVIVQTVRLHQIRDAESVVFAGTCVGCSEVEPLRISFRKIIWLQNQVVIIFVDLDGPS